MFKQNIFVELTNFVESKNTSFTKNEENIYFVFVHAYVRMTYLVVYIYSRKFRNIALTRSLSVFIWFNDFSEGIPRRRAKTDEDFEERNGSLSVHRYQRCATGDQQTYFCHRPL